MEFSFRNGLGTIGAVGSPPLLSSVLACSDDCTEDTAAGGPWKLNQERFMRALISALAVAGVVAFALPAYAADENAPSVTAPNKPKAAGRAIEGDAVTAPNKPKAAGRAIEGDAVTAPNKAKTAGRAIDDGTVKSKPKKHSQAGRAVDADNKVKSGPKDQPGRAADKQ